MKLILIAALTLFSSFAFANPPTSGTLSDARAKENIVQIPDATALSAITCLKPSSYNLIGNPAPAGTEFGFIAQEYFNCFPQFTFTNGIPPTGPLNPGDIPWSIYIDGIIPYLPGAIKALKTAVDATPSQTVGAEGDLGTLTWGGTAPSGTLTKKFRCTKTGKIATLDFNVRASIAGLLVLSMAADLPASCPTPSIFSNVAQNTIAVQGAGSFLGGANANLLGGGAALFRGADAGGIPTYQIRLTTTAGLAATGAQGQVQYLTN